MPHNRKLVLSGIGMTMARIPAKKSINAMVDTREEIEKSIINSGYLDNAPFEWIGISIRKGLKDDSFPHYYKIDKNDGELPLAIEIDTHRLLNTTQEEMANIYRKAALLALVHAGDKYGLQTDKMKELLADMEEAT